MPTRMVRLSIALITLFCIPAFAQDSAQQMVQQAAPEIPASSPATTNPTL